MRASTLSVLVSTDAHTPCAVWPPVACPPPPSSSSAHAAASSVNAATNTKMGDNRLIMTPSTSRPSPRSDSSSSDYRLGLASEQRNRDSRPGEPDPATPLVPRQMDAGRPRRELAVGLEFVGAGQSFEAVHVPHGRTSERVLAPWRIARRRIHATSEASAAYGPGGRPKSALLSWMNRRSASLVDVERST